MPLGTPVAIPLVTLNNTARSWDVPAPAGLSNVEFFVDRAAGTRPLDGDASASIALDLLGTWDGTAWVRLLSTVFQGGPRAPDPDLGTQDYAGAYGIAPGMLTARVSVVVTGRVSISGSVMPT